MKTDSDRQKLRQAHTNTKAERQRLVRQTDWGTGKGRQRWRGWSEAEEQVPARYRVQVRPGGTERERAEPESTGSIGEASVTDRDRKVMEGDRERETVCKARMSQEEGLGKGAVWAAPGPGDTSKQTGTAVWAGGADLLSWLGGGCQHARSLPPPDPRA